MLHLLAVREISLYSRLNSHMLRPNVGGCNQIRIRSWRKSFCLDCSRLSKSHGISGYSHQSACRHTSTARVKWSNSLRRSTFQTWPVLWQLGRRNRKLLRCDVVVGKSRKGRPLLLLRRDEMLFMVYGQFKRFRVPKLLIAAKKTP